MRALPLAMCVGFLLVTNVSMHANALDNGIDDEKMEEMLRSILNT